MTVSLYMFLLWLLTLLGDAREMFRGVAWSKRGSCQWLHSRSLWCSSGFGSLSFLLLLWLRSWRWSLFRVSSIVRMIHFCTLYSYVCEEAFKVVEGTDPILIGFTGAIFPWRGQARVEVKSELLTVLHS